MSWRASAGSCAAILYQLQKAGLRATSGLGASGIDGCTRCIAEVQHAAVAGLTVLPPAVAFADVSSLRLNLKLSQACASVADVGDFAEKGGKQAWIR